LSKVSLLLSVDWEGEDFSSLRDLYALRREIGDDVPLTHFVCPAYFVKYPSAPGIVSDSIRENDEVALHLHPLRELVEYFDISFRTKHNFYRARSGMYSQSMQHGITVSRFDEDSSSGRTSMSLSMQVRSLMSKCVPSKIKNVIRRPITGRGVPLSVYNQEELVTLICGCRELLEEHLGREVTGFRAGGNMASDVVLGVLGELGFAYDASAFPPSLLSREYDLVGDGSGLDIYGADNGLYRDYILRLWGRDRQDEGFLANRLMHEALSRNSERMSNGCVNLKKGSLGGATDRKGEGGSAFIEEVTQPFQLGGLMAYPINGGMSDFAHARKTLLPLFERLLQKAEETGKQQVMSLGFHMEGDWRYKVPVMEFLAWLEKQYAGRYEFSVHGRGSRNLVQYA